ncbi:hypothetical protein A6F55_21145 [Prescottella equi]|uniref:hypothetical protein n=1 Tax=Rhodococcus hoagii TaxID=43767 RepID=UPI000A1008D9|nr:hypothetical protein [Prescottella equi]ORJ97473.1 hypothetical protein A6F55_21145 [Prescottella equi]
MAEPAAQLLAVYDFLSDWLRYDGFWGCGFINVVGELASAKACVAEVGRELKTEFQRYIDALRLRPVLEISCSAPILADSTRTAAAIARSADGVAHARKAAVTLIIFALSR